MPILEGLDGVQKMSKSLGNYIGVTDAPAEMFGKTMSISDELMARYYRLLLGEDFPPAVHPMEAKKNLAARLVARYHSEAEAQAARDDFEQRFSKRDTENAELPTIALVEHGADIVSVVGHAYAQAFSMTKSRGDARRLVEGGSVQWRGEKVSDAKAQPDFASGGVLKLDKIRAVRIAGWRPERALRLRRSSFGRLRVKPQPVVPGLAELVFGLEIGLVELVGTDDLLKNAAHREIRRCPGSCTPRRWQSSW